MPDKLLVAFLLAVNLALVSYLLYVRLGAGGAPVGLIRRLVAELWVSFAVATLLLLGVSRLLGPTGAQGATGEVISIGDRFRALSGYEQVLSISGAVLAIGMVLLVMRRMNRLIAQYPPRVPPPADEQ